MKRKFSGSAVPRHYIFVLLDGTFVIQWAERKVQDIMTGQFRKFNYTEDYGHAIMDGELYKLKAAARVEHFNRRYIWIFALPERGRYDKELKTLERNPNRIRAFYITTPLPKSQLDNVQAILPSLNLTQLIQAKIQNDQVAIFGDANQPFYLLQDVEDVIQRLLEGAPDVFAGASVAMFEMAVNNDKTLRQPVVEEVGRDGIVNLETLIRSQSDISVTKGKIAVVIGEKQPLEKQALIKLLTETLKMQVLTCKTAKEALPLLEDCLPALTLIDLELSDMHGWNLVRNIREVSPLQRMCIIVFSENPRDEVFALRVAKVAAYQSRPLNLRKLREKIWFILRNPAGCGS